MKEDFLYFIWKFQYFNFNNLTTESGQQIIVSYPGFQNANAGPDFLNAKVTISGIEWVGNVEIHSKTSDWNRHKHDLNNAYETTVLHVVWQHDKYSSYSDGTEIPVLSLKDRVLESLIDRYDNIQNSIYKIPCQTQIHTIKKLIITQTFEKALVNRLEQKSLAVKVLLEENNGDWRETTYQLLAQNMGFKVNKETFLELAKKTKYSLLQKHIDQPLQVEAFLFGQSGLIPSRRTSKYEKELYREYSFIEKKYKLNPLDPVSWKFMRLRPANFPTIRISQFAAILQKNLDLFSTLLELPSMKDYISFFNVEGSNYWDNHYLFETESSTKKKRLGKQSIYNIIINTICPLLAFYAIHKNEMQYMDKAIKLLEAIPNEKNKITRLWNNLNIQFKNAADSQGAIQLFNESCSKKKCLDCSIGYTLLKEEKNN